MFLSVFDIFKIGIGPSSSHTIGPMVAAARFLKELKHGDWPRPVGVEPAHISVTLHGSLAFTGKGHATDRAIILGLCGQTPVDIDPDEIDAILQEASRKKHVLAQGFESMRFDPERDLVFDYGDPLEGHANGMIFSARDTGGGLLLKRIYYSVGGGFVVDDEELAGMNKNAGKPLIGSVPFPFGKAKDMLQMGKTANMSIAQMKRANELANNQALNSEGALDNELDAIWAAMKSCMERGLRQSGELPGGLRIRRRAREIHQKLLLEHGTNVLQPHLVMDWLSVYAMAVNEENAAGGKVVTAPTNGAAGVIPAVIRYYLDHCIDADQKGVRTFLLTAAAIGGIIKQNASISGAEVGCQGEVGSASAMAAAGFAAALGGTNEQVENAAEIALEHHLGMTCDPIAGLVQVPCIERNGLGAVKAVAAASLALRGDGKHFVPLDNCIETMRQTGLDMSEKYKETSKGGLAVNVVEC